jgi:hypothetical protein
VTVTGQTSSDEEFNKSSSVLALMKNDLKSVGHALQAGLCFFAVIKKKENSKVLVHVTAIGGISMQ